MIDLSSFLELFLQRLTQTFGNRIRFVGLQGSYGRGEATASSDVDLVVILDALSPADISSYNELLDTLPHREMLCGFLSGKEEILNWDVADLFQFYHDTTPVLGSLKELLPEIDTAAVSRAIKLGACNIYHGCVHNMLYEKSDEMLKGLYKAASFVAQAIYYQQAGVYLAHQAELLAVSEPAQQEIVRTFLALKGGEPVRFREMSETLFTWASAWIQNTK